MLISKLHFSRLSLLCLSLITCMTILPTQATGNTQTDKSVHINKPEITCANPTNTHDSSSNSNPTQADTTTKTNEPDQSALEKYAQCAYDCSKVVCMAKSLSIGFQGIPYVLSLLTNRPIVVRSKFMYGPDRILNSPEIMLTCLHHFLYAYYTFTALGESILQNYCDTPMPLPHLTSKDEQTTVLKKIKKTIDTMGPMYCTAVHVGQLASCGSQDFTFQKFIHILITQHALWKTQKSKN